MGGIILAMGSSSVLHVRTVFIEGMKSQMNEIRLHDLSTPVIMRRVGIKEEFMLSPHASVPVCRCDAKARAGCGRLRGVPLL